MQIAIVGYGKMGKEIERVAISRGHSISHKINTENQQEVDDLEDADVAIEFTTPKSALNNYNRILKTGTPVVTGTTGWYDDIDLVNKIVKDTNTAFFWASNFSLGVNLFFEINKKLAALLNNQTDYKAVIEETHHTEKLDKPSGTAISIAQQIIENNEEYYKWISDADGVEGELPVFAHRKPGVPGTHLVTWNSEIDQIKLEHTAHSRRGFSLGAVLAAEFIVKQKTGVYTMKNLLKLS